MFKAHKKQLNENFDICYNAQEQYTLSPLFLVPSLVSMSAQASHYNLDTTKVQHIWCDSCLKKMGKIQLPPFRRSVESTHRGSPCYSRSPQATQTCLSHSYSLLCNVLSTEISKMDQMGNPHGRKKVKGPTMFWACAHIR